jgi:hypothetical protein
MNACKQKGESSDETTAGSPAEIGTVIYNTNDPASMIKAIAKANGGIANLKALKDVQFDYNYETPDGRKDVSLERYIFDNEISWARYTTHEVNVFPDSEDPVVQFYDGTKCSLYKAGEAVMDTDAIGLAKFLRQANYMWFNMMFKLGDPGTIYEYLGQETVDGKTFDTLKVTYDPKITGKVQNDIFILFIDPATHIVARFNFSLPIFLVNEPVLLAKLTYTEIDGIQVITKREMFGPIPDGSGMEPLLEQNTMNVKFNNGFTVEQLSKDI